MNARAAPDTARAMDQSTNRQKKTASDTGAAMEQFRVQCNRDASERMSRSGLTWYIRIFNSNRKTNTTPSATVVRAPQVATNQRGSPTIRDIAVPRTNTNASKRVSFIATIRGVARNSSSRGRSTWTLFRQW